MSYTTEDVLTDPKSAAIAGPAEWDSVKKTVVLTGAPTAEFSTGD